MLQLISKSNDGITLSEISQKLDIPVSSTSDILCSFLETDMVEVRNSRLKSYVIGPTAYNIGTSFARNSSLLDKSRRIVDELSKTLNKTVFLGKPANNRVVYIYKHEPDS